MELPVGNIPWLRGLGAVGAVAAMVTGGAVTTAGAIDDPAGAEPQATVQLMATDSTGQWYSCDLALDIGGSGGAFAITASGPDGAPAGGMTVVHARGEAPVPGEPVTSVGAVPATDIAVSGRVEAGAVGAGGGPADGQPGLTVTGELNGSELSTAAVPVLPDPAAVRTGTSEECDSVSVSATQVAPGLPVGTGTGTGGGATAGGAQED